MTMPGSPAPTLPEPGPQRTEQARRLLAKLKDHRNSAIYLRQGLEALTEAAGTARHDLAADRLRLHGPDHRYRQTVRAIGATAEAAGPADQEHRLIACLIADLTGKDLGTALECAAPEQVRAALLHTYRHGEQYTKALALRIGQEHEIALHAIMTGLLENNVEGLAAGLNRLDRADEAADTLLTGEPAQEFMEQTPGVPPQDTTFTVAQSSAFEMAQERVWSLGQTVSELLETMPKAAAATAASMIAAADLERAKQDLAVRFEARGVHTPAAATVARAASEQLFNRDSETGMNLRLAYSNRNQEAATQAIRDIKNAANLMAATAERHEQDRTLEEISTPARGETPEEYLTRLEMKLKELTVPESAGTEAQGLRMLHRQARRILEQDIGELRKSMDKDDFRPEQTEEVTDALILAAITQSRIGSP